MPLMRLHFTIPFENEEKMKAKTYLLALGSLPSRSGKASEPSPRVPRDPSETEGALVFGPMSLQPAWWARSFLPVSGRCRVFEAERLLRLPVSGGQGAQGEQVGLLRETERALLGGIQPVAVVRCQRTRVGGYRLVGFVAGLECKQCVVHNSIYDRVVE